VDAEMNQKFRGRMRDLRWAIAARVKSVARLEAVAYPWLCDDIF
jgi:hypothetical protein